MRLLWGGAFEEGADALVEAFGQSIDSDLEFWREDVEGSIAHARMLGRQGIISSEDSEALVSGLGQILAEGPDSLPHDVEDIHTAVELRLKELVGEPALRLHTARSRNDQVALDVRLWLRRASAGLRKDVKQLQAVLARLAEEKAEVLLPGVTHQQHAQPITLGFHFLGHFWAMQRHGARLENLESFLESSPLGSAALSGTGFPIDRAMTARELGFEAPHPHAMDATSDRSFILEALHCCSLVMIDLSRMSQEIVLWSSPEFGWIRLSDAVTTGSSIMPQKRNPDMAELIRGRTGRVIGSWTGLACTMKGLVLGYNRDTQEDKPPLFEAVKTTAASLKLAALMLEGAVFRTDRMAASCRGDFSTATDLADLLASEGMPFRLAHEATGRLVRLCESQGKGLEDLTAAEIREAAPLLNEEAASRILPCLTPEASVRRRASEGGTAPVRVKEQAERCRSLAAQDGFRPFY